MKMRKKGHGKLNPGLVRANIECEIINIKVSLREIESNLKRL